jgi:micrococcal nuclease
MKRGEVNLTVFTTIILVIFLVGLKSHAEPEITDPVRISRVDEVYDGDTLYVTIDGWPKILGERIGLRLLGIDTPEMRGTSPCIKAMAHKSKEALEDIVRNANKLEIYLGVRGKYFRIVADVYADGENISEKLIKRGRAKVWDGEGARPKWLCDSTWFKPEELENLTNQGTRDILIPEPKFLYEDN